MSASISICNQALSLVGADHITSIDDGTNEARQCKVHYDACLRKILMEREWTFATARRELAEVSEAPTFGYTKAFGLPGDCILVRSASDRTGYEYRDWVVEGRKISLNADTCFIVYTKMEYDATKYPGPFEAALVHLLASRLSISIPNSRGLSQDHYTLYQMELREASGLDGKQGSPTAIGNRNSKLISARYR
jgi:hypothetical protein